MSLNLISYIYVRMHGQCYVSTTITSLHTRRQHTVHVQAHYRTRM